MFATLFICLNSVILIGLKLYQFSKRFKEHVNTYGTTPTAPSGVLQLEMKNEKNDIANEV